ncbi:peptidoglycan DD-metalloendopeptidase family protein [Iodidimonas sp. SYSU 1G8]|uniref:murein hydrolase activator EnvC family protein n=1 Tax=Iodidimonas sp. SYSU 1G8 TaxID=3133967 RepID=UPI0031FF07F4
MTLPRRDLAGSLCLAALILLMAGGTAFAAPPNKGEAQDRLQSIKQEMDEAAAKRKKLAQEAAALKEEERKLSVALVEAAARTREHEVRIQALEEQLTDLQAREVDAARTLETKSNDLASSMAAMQRLSRQPTAALVLRPASVDDTARTAIVLDRVRDALVRQAADLRSQMEDLRTLRQNIELQQAALRTQHEELAARQKDVDRLLADKKASRTSTESAAKKEAERARKLAKDAKSIEALLRKLEEQARRDREREREREKARKTPKKPDGPAFSGAEGKLPLPVQGKIIRRFQDKDDSGRASSGIYVEARGSAQVISPHDGKVVFAGPFRDYGQLLIIDHGEGYHTLLAGMGQIDAAVSQSVLAGEPVGQMGPERAGPARDSKPRLYIELRRNGRSINPLPWLAGR